MDTVIVKSVSIESFEKKRVTITITIIIKEMYIEMNINYTHKK